MAQQIATISLAIFIILIQHVYHWSESGEISYGKMVDLLNEIAIKWHNKQQ